MNFYGDDARWFVGRVIQSLDPLGKGRVKVRIVGLHSEDVNDEDLPWAKCVLPTTEGGTSGIGKIPKILNDAFCFGIFLDGKLSQSPVVLGSLNHFGVPSSVQQKEVNKSGRPYTLIDDYVVEGILINPDLRQMYNEGESTLQTKMVVVMQYLIDNGLSKEAAAGVVGNLVRESNLDPTAEAHTSAEDSYGIGQWNARVGRYELLLNFAKKRQKPWEEFFVQLEFLVYDMKTNPAHKVWTRLSDRSQTVTFDGVANDSNATYYFMRKYEVPKDQLIELEYRERFAREAFDVYSESIAKTSSYVSSAGAG